MTVRQHFNRTPRDSACTENANWLRKHKVDGIALSLAFEPLRARGLVYYCEHCLFCHTEREHFDIDHLMADKTFKDWDRHEDGRMAINMVVLCKSLQRSERPFVWSQSI